MRTFAHKPESNQKTKSTTPAKPGSAFSGQSREVSSILHSQCTIGNQAVQRLLQANAEELEEGLTTTASTHFAHDFGRIMLHAKAHAGIQPRLTISTPGDIYEQEADRVADQVMRMPEPKLQRACVCGGTCPKCKAERLSHERERLQTKRVRPSNAEQVSPPQIVHEVLQSPGQPLDSATRAFMESRFGREFNHVRIHTGPEAAESARELSALAYTIGRHIVFGAGEFRPATPDGRRLLAHELAHVTQLPAPGCPAPIRRQYGDLPPGGMPSTSGPGSPSVGRECPCNAFPSREEAIRDREARWPSMRSDIADVAGESVARVYDLFVHGGSGSEIDLSSTAGHDFAQSETTQGAARHLTDALRRSMTAQPIALPEGRRTMRHVPVTERLSHEIAELGDPTSRYRMNFTRIGSVPGTLAGDIGETDRREARVVVDLRRVSPSQVEVQPRITFTVKDIVDFCPGDCGTDLEREYTVPMSRWEATGIAHDVPFRVVFIVEPPSFLAPYTVQPMSDEQIISEITSRYLYIVLESGRARMNMEEMGALAGEIGELVRRYVASGMREGGVAGPAQLERLREELLADGRINPDDVDNIFQFAEWSGQAGGER